MSPSDEALPARLRAARERAELTQAQVADELGVSRPLLIAIEKGTRAVAPEQLVRLAAIYGVSVSELLRPAPPPLSIGARFRMAIAAAPESETVAASVHTLERLADDYLDLLRRSGANLPGVYPSVRPIDHLDPNRAAEDLAVEERLRLGLGDGPIDGLREVLELDVGLRVFLVRLPPRVAGLFVYVEPLGGCVAVNADHPAQRRRWTMAHEYAHFLASRGRSEVTSLAPKRRSDSELFAEAFAAHFLMPRSGLARRFHELKRSSGRAITPAVLVQLAHSYRVTIQALALMLEELDLVRRGTWERLHGTTFLTHAMAARLGLRIRVEFADMLPTHYRTLAVQLFAEAEITEGQLARFLHTDIVGARRCFQAMTETNDVAEDGSIQTVSLAGAVA